MALRSLAAAAFLSFTTATMGIAAPIDFNFSFTDGTNTIYGLIEGLDSNGTDQSASQITVNGGGVNPSMTVGAGDPANNRFTVNNGVIDTSSVYFSFQGFGPFIWQGGAAFVLDGATPYFRLFQASNAGLSGTQVIFDTTSTVINFSPVASVPLPAGGLLLLTGMAGAVSLRRRKKRAS